MKKTKESGAGEIDVKVNHCEPLVSPKTCIIYSRVSTADQETQNQTDQLRDFAVKNGWIIKDIITDVSSGGKSISERTGLNSVFERAHRRAFDILLFWSLDRLSREGSRKTIQYLAQLEEYGVSFHSFTESYLSSMGPFSDCIISLLSTLAKQERIRISERTKAGLERTRKNGTRLGRPRTPVTKINQAMKLRDEGLTFKQIAEKLKVTPARAHQLVHLNR